MRIALLADHPDCIPDLAQWFRAQWPDYYAGRTPADIERDFHRELNRATLPLRLVALDDHDRSTGTVVLRQYAINSSPHHSPGLGGLYVHPPHRRHGIATALVHAATQTAQQLGLETLYAATTTAANVFTRLGWQRV